MFVYMAFLVFNQKTKPEVPSCVKKTSKQIPTVRSYYELIFLQAL